MIVNAANTHLGGGGGIDSSIHKKGGATYCKAHQALSKQHQKNYTQGYASMLPSGDLQQNYGIGNVIVVAGPQNVSNEANNSALYSCYYNSLVLADQQRKESIAFPSISTGIFHFPPENAASISLRAIYDFTTKYPDSSLHTISIHFLPNEDDPLKNYRNALKTSEESIYFPV